MNIFRNKILVKFIAIICIFLTLINFGLPNKSYAEDDNEVWGGILITPITNLLTGLADGIISLLHKAVQKQDVSIIEISGTPQWWNQWGEAALELILVVAIVAVAAAFILNPVLAAPTIIAGLGKALSTAALVIGVEVLNVKITGEGVVTYWAPVVAEKFRKMVWRQFVHASFYINA